MLKNKIFIMILLLLALIFHAHGAEVEPTKPDSPGAQMVGAGMNVFAYSIGDSIIELGSGNETIDRAETPGIIFKLITFTVDPYSFEYVKKWQNTMIVFYVCIFILVCLFGAALVLLQKMAPDTMNRFLWLMAEDSSFDLRAWLGRMALGLVFPFITAFLVYIVLQLNYAVSGLLTSSFQNAVPPTTNNIIAYLFMAVAYLVLSILFAMRNIIIVLFAAGALGIAALYLIPYLQDYVKSVIAYFIVVVFMQPALIFVAGIGVMFLQTIPPELSNFVAISYLGLILLLVVMGVICILGWGVVNRIVGMSIQRRYY